MFFRNYIFMSVLFLFISFSNKKILFRIFFAFKKTSIYVNYNDNTARQNVSTRNLLKIHFISVKMITWIIVHHIFYTYTNILLIRDSRMRRTWRIRLIQRIQRIWRILILIRI